MTSSFPHDKIVVKRETVPLVKFHLLLGPQQSELFSLIPERRILLPEIASSLFSFTVSMYSPLPKDRLFYNDVYHEISTIFFFLSERYKFMTSKR